MEIKVKAVKLFCAVVEAGSLLAAANKLSLSPSAASREISTLEMRLGVKLFHRTNKELTLTPEGENFYRTATECTQAWKQVEEWAERLKNKKKTLRIAVLARHCSDIILPAISAVLSRHKKRLSVSIDIHTSRDIYYSKHSHPFDIGFGTLLTEHDDLVKEPLAYLPLKIVVSRDSPLAKKRKIKRTDLEKENLILLSHDIPEAKLEMSLLPDINSEKIVAEVSTTQVALRLVKHNLGVHITDELALFGLIKDCVALDFEEKETIPFYVFYPKNTTLNRPEAKELISLIASSIASQGMKLTPWGEKYLT